MKIYFAGSITGGRGDAEVYSSIVDYLKQYGSVLTEHIADANLTHTGEELSEIDIYERDIAWVKEADVIIAEVSTPSLGVGYEIGQAEAWGKKILCLYKPQENKRLSAMIRGNKSITIRDYNSLEEMFQIIDKFLS